VDIGASLERRKSSEGIPNKIHSSYTACSRVHVEHHSEIVVPMTRIADRRRKAQKPIALVEGDCGGHLGHRLRITALESQGSRRLEASIEKGLSNSLAAVLGAKIHPLQFAGAPLFAGQRENSSSTQNLAFLDGDKVGGAAVLINI
jgi:hypothetical protein